MMHEHIKRKWLDALRSGDYEQGQNYLRYRDSYCCLGVLCDLYNDEAWGFRTEDGHTHSDDNVYLHSGEATVLPKEVQEWAGLKDPNPAVVMEDKATSKRAYFDSIGQLNDGGVGFDKIADIIEEQL